MSVLGRSTELCPSQSRMEIYSFEPQPAPVLSCNGSKEYVSMHDRDGHSLVDLPSTDFSPISSQLITNLKSAAILPGFQLTNPI